MRTPQSLPASATGARLAPTTLTLLVALSIHLLGLTASITAAPKDLDPEFGTGGRLALETPAYGETWDHVISLAGGECLAMSYEGVRTNITKLTKVGTPSADFGIAGQVRLSFGGLVAVRPDGKIVAAGSARYSLNNVNRVRITVTRLLANGNPDTSFGGDGSVEFDNTESALPSVSSMGFAHDGKILLGGYVRPNEWGYAAIVRLTPEGYLDASFSGDGIATFGIGGACNGLVPLQDGSIMAAGSGVQVWRLLADGNLDPNFGSAGRVLLDIDTLSEIQVRPNGKFLVSGYRTQIPDANINSFFVSLNPNGSLDTSFGTGGKVEIDAGGGVADYPRSTAIMPDGRIVVAGAVNEVSGMRFPVFRLMPDGTLDPSFGSGYTMQIPGTEYFDCTFARDMAIDSSGRILVIGGCYYPSGSGGMLVRLKGDPDTDGDGIVDASENNSGIFVSAFNTGSSPSNPDTDGDGIPDGSEVYRYGSNPNLPDTDGDGFLDGYEVATGKSPVDPLSKPALVAEARTAIEFTFPAAIGKTYRIEASTDLAAWEIVECGIVGTGGQVQRFYSTRGQTKRYFRVEEVAP